jgi:hypothetical protein
MAVSLATALLLTLFAVWLIATPYPFAGEPVVTLRIPPVEELKTASIDKAPDAEAAAEKPAEAEESARPVRRRSSKSSRRRRRRRSRPRRPSSCRRAAA